MPQLAKSLIVGRYRCFRDDWKMPLGRLSLVYGVNSSGKSALLRLPALLAGSMASQTVGLNLAHPTLGDAPFKELVWDHGDGELLLLGFEDHSGGRWTWSLEWSEQLGEPVVRSFEAPSASGPTCWDWSQAHRDETGQVRTYRPNSGGNSVEVAWHGLRPELAGVDAAPLTALEDGVVWLTTSRTAPTREGVRRGVRVLPDPRGGDWAASLCVRDADLMARVSDWYQANVSAVLALSTPEERVRIRLRGTRENAPDIPFPDVGEGLQQVFPVLVALERLRSHGGLLCVEEPEAHLHPSLQRALARRMVDVLQEQPDAQILLETHSEVLLYEALLQAAGDLQDDVSLTWLDSAGGNGTRVQPVGLDPSGRPTDDALRRSFSALGALRREVIEARRHHAS